MKLTVKQITITGILGAIALVLGSTPLGFIPVPTPAGAATIMHIPVIIGAIMEGPIVGAFVGLIFGLFSFLRGGSPLFADPLIAILPRVLIGILAAYSYNLFSNKLVGAVGSATVGTLTNTIGVLSLAVIRGFLPNKEAAIGIGLTHGTPEVIVGIIITVIVVKALQKTDLN